MKKTYENHLPKELQNKLQDQYQDLLQEKYGIFMGQSQICDLTEFLAKQQPERYDNHMYRSSEELQKIGTVIDFEKKIAVMINLNDTQNSKIPQGEFGTYDFQKHKFHASEAIQYKIRKTVEKMANGTLTAEEEKELVQKMLPKTLDSMEKMATIENEIESRSRKLVDQKIDEKNEKNGISKKERKQIENKKKQDELQMEGQENPQSQEKIPKDVKKACQRLGVTKIKSYFYVHANELSEKVDGTRVNENGNPVLMLEVADSSKVTGPNKYYGMQDNKMVLYGNQNEEVRDVTGNVTQMGKVVKPLKIQSANYVEYENEEGFVIREQIDDRAQLSVQEMSRYKEEMEKLLEKYAQNIYAIKDSDLSPERKMEEIQKIDDWCDKETTAIALRNNVSLKDDKNIDTKTDEYTAKIQQEIEQNSEEEAEIEAFEVPGKRKR